MLPALPDEVYALIVDESLEVFPNPEQTWAARRHTLLILSRVNSTFRHYAQRALLRRITLKGS